MWLGKGLPQQDVSGIHAVHSLSPSLPGWLSECKYFIGCLICYPLWYLFLFQFACWILFVFRSQVCLLVEICASHLTADHWVQTAHVSTQYRDYTIGGEQEWSRRKEHLRWMSDFSSVPRRPWQGDHYDYDDTELRWLRTLLTGKPDFS